MNYYVNLNCIDQTMNLMNVECELIIWLNEWHIMTNVRSLFFASNFLFYLISFDVQNKKFFLKKFSNVLYLSIIHFVESNNDFVDEFRISRFCERRTIIDRKLITTMIWTIRIIFFDNLLTWKCWLLRKLSIAETIRIIFDSSWITSILFDSNVKMWLSFDYKTKHDICVMIKTNKNSAIKWFKQSIWLK